MRENVCTTPMVYESLRNLRCGNPLQWYHVYQFEVVFVYDQQVSVTLLSSDKISQIFDCDVLQRSLGSEELQIFCVLKQFEALPGAGRTIPSQCIAVDCHCLPVEEPYQGL